MKHFRMDDFNFPVESQPVFDAAGIEIAGHQNIVRLDTGASMGLHKSRYKIVSHDDVVNSVLDGVKAANLSDDYEVSVDVFENGRKLRGEILFNNLTVEPEVGDYVKYRATFSNSYDASWPFAQAASGLRLWCLNGCTTADAIAFSRYKHTASINVDGSAAKIITGLEHFKDQKDVWQSWMKTKVEHDQVESFLKKTVAKAYTRQQAASKTNEKQLENLLRIWGDERSSLGSNKWALYNCLTYWATHTGELKSPHTARYEREAKIASAMKTTQWKEMV
jgi:hypothetical protein